MWAIYVQGGDVTFIIYGDKADHQAVELCNQGFWVPQQKLKMLPPLGLLTAFQERVRDGERPVEDREHRSFVNCALVKKDMHYL